MEKYDFSFLDMAKGGIQMKFKTSVNDMKG